MMFKFKPCGNLMLAAALINFKISEDSDANSSHCQIDVAAGHHQQDWILFFKFTMFSALPPPSFTHCF